MAHRDDYEAALARIGALERELASSQGEYAKKVAELAALRKELESQEPPKDSESPEWLEAAPSSKFSRGPIVYGLVLVAIAIALLFLIKDPS